jgi:hypothetical protein
MLSVIAITQAVFVALGTMAMIVLSKADPDSVDSFDRLRGFLASQGLWLLLIPVAWFITAQFLVRRKPGVEPAANGSGIAIAGALLIAYGLVILF